MTAPLSPYMRPGFYDRALAEGRHRDIVGGRWDETGRAQMALLRAAGLRPQHHLLDIGAGSLRLGCKAVPYLEPGHYWATDASLALMLRGHAEELSPGDRARLPREQLIEDATFAFPGVPARITHAIAFAVFTHLPSAALASALVSIRQRFPELEYLAFTVFLAPDAGFGMAFRQRDGVVTHPDRAPWHLRVEDVMGHARQAGFEPGMSDLVLPRGQRLIEAIPRP